MAVTNEMRGLKTMVDKAWSTVCETYPRAKLIVLTMDARSVKEVLAGGTVNVTAFIDKGEE